MLLRVSDHTASSWNSLVDEFRDTNLIQTWEWGEAKAKTGPWSVERLEFVEQGKIVGLAQVLVRRLPLLLGGMAWLNRGPLWDQGQGDEALPRMLRLLGEHYSAKRRLYFRVAPTVAEGRLAAVLPSDNSFQNAGISGHRAGRIDLTQPESRLRSGLKQSWRRFLVKAERLDTTILVGREEAIFNRFLHAYGNILEQATYRKSTTPDLLAELRERLPDHRKLIVFEAVADGEPISWVVIATYGTTGEYLAAATLPAGRKRNCGQLLTWNAMLQLKAEGYRVLDIGGFDPEDVNSGVSHFKSGTNAVPYHLCSEIDCHSSLLKKNVIRKAIKVGRIPIRLPILSAGKSVTADGRT
jgi:lipid II:glycine glycyltransferase (peptidoglycan interpeptide bridge formation enzyme)